MVKRPPMKHHTCLLVAIFSPLATTLGPMRVRAYQ